LDPGESEVLVVSAVQSLLCICSARDGY